MSALNKEEPRLFFRRMKTEDIPSVLEIERLSFTNPWSRETFVGEIQNDIISFPLVLIEKPESRLVGYLVYWRIHDDVQINNIAVHPDYRGRGFGEAMLRSLIKNLKKEEVTFISLEVRCSNTPAISLYRKFGFEVIGKRTGYYTNPDEDAYIMALTMK